MVVRSNLDFAKSLWKELLAVKDRVRNLIGSAHWWEEGRFKESVLRNMIRKFTPNNVSIWTWFIFNKEKISNQIDILVYDNTFPISFCEWDFVILPEVCVKAVIEVKTKITNSGNNSLKEVITSFNKSINWFDGLKSTKVFKWIFSFDTNFKISSNDFKAKIRESLYLWWDWINHISLWDDIFLKNRNDKISVYKLQNLSFSYFIWNIISFIWQNNQEIDEALFSQYFPLENWWKENYKVFDIHLL
jgi:hypothetical protein